MRILVVDDDPEIRNLLKRALAYEGYAVDLAENGAEALEHALGERVDRYDPGGMQHLATQWLPIGMLEGQAIEIAVDASTDKDASTGPKLVLEEWLVEKYRLDGSRWIGERDRGDGHAAL